MRATGVEMTRRLAGADSLLKKEANPLHFINDRWDLTLCHPEIRPFFHKAAKL